MIIFRGFKCLSPTVQMNHQGFKCRCPVGEAAYTPKGSNVFLKKGSNDSIGCICNIIGTFNICTFLQVTFVPFPNSFFFLCRPLFF